MTYESPNSDATDGTNTLPGLVKCLALERLSANRTKYGKFWTFSSSKTLALALLEQASRSNFCLHQLILGGRRLHARPVAGGDECCPIVRMLVFGVMEHFQLGLAQGLGTSYLID